jgi:hypothetical protein
MGAHDEFTTLPETPTGFRCAYLFTTAAVIVQVRERRLAFRTQHETFWQCRSAAVVYFACSLEDARTVIERHVAPYDSELSSTLGPVWDYWISTSEAPPVEQGPRTPPQTPLH